MAPRYYDRTGRQERSVEEDFLEGFGRPTGSTLRSMADTGPTRTVDDSKALQQRFTELQEQSHSQSFEAWMRSRNMGNMVVTTETLLRDKANISEDTYEKVRLPKARVTTVTRKDAAPETLRSWMSAQLPADKKTSPLSLAAQCTEVTFPKLARVLDWRECLVHIEFAPISPLDLFVARRGADALFRDDLKLEAPHALGNAGVAVIETLGPGVNNSYEVGDWVVPARDGLGTFRSLAVWNEDDFIKVPKGLMPLEYMACHRELCLAYYLMETCAADLKAGDALLINAANGAVGQVVIQLCRLMNLRAIAVVRRHDNFSDTKAWLDFLGAYKVFADDEPIVPILKREYAALPNLAFDGVGGFASLKLVRTLAPGSTVVTYGFASETAAHIPWQVIVHSRVTIRGFELLDWLNDPAKSSANRKKFIQILEQMAKLVNAGKLRISMEEMPLEQWYEALSNAEPGMNTKIVLKPLTLNGEQARELDKAAEVERLKKVEEDRRHALRVAANELFLGPPWDLASFEQETTLEGCYEIAPTMAPWRATLVWLHGNSEIPQEYTALFDRHLLAKHEGVKIVMPTPRTMKPDRRDQLAPEPDWFPLDDRIWKEKYLATHADSDVTEDDIALLTKLEAAADWIGAIVDRELRTCPDKSKVVLAGFAHGGVVALYAALTKLTDRLPCVITLAAPCVLPHFLASKVKSHLRDTPITCFAGSKDEVFDSAQQREVVDSTLSAVLPNVTFEQIPNGEHDISSLEIKTLEAAFARVTS